MEILEGILGAELVGAIPIFWYFWKRVQKKKQLLIEKDKELQTQVDIIQDLKTDIKMLNMKVQMLEKS